MVSCGASDCAAGGAGVCVDCVAAASHWIIGPASMKLGGPLLVKGCGASGKGEDCARACRLTAANSKRSRARGAAGAAFSEALGWIAIVIQE